MPGHHLQLATAQTLDIPRYRRHIDAELCAFNEGWGLYSERLADEIGLYSDPESCGSECCPSRRCGPAGSSWTPACTDLGWSRQQAIDFMDDHTRHHARQRAQRSRPVHRLARQALAYVTGKREIVRLRERARGALGPRFDLRRFHHAVLRNGAIPLTLLDDEIERWTTTEA